MIRAGKEVVSVEWNCRLQITDKFIHAMFVAGDMRSKADETDRKLIRSWYYQSMKFVLTVRFSSLTI